MNVTKNWLMKQVAMGRSRECFEDSVYGIFDITSMRNRAPEIGEHVVVPLSEVIPFIYTNRVTEPSRVVALQDASWRDDPGIFIIVPDAEHGQAHVMVDGHHRALRRAMEGEADMHFWFIPLAKAIRPSAGWGTIPGLDWGDKIVDGKIIRNG